MAILDLGTYKSELKRFRDDYPDSTGTVLFEKYASLDSALCTLAEEGEKVKVALAKLSDELNAIVTTPPSKWPEALLGPPVGFISNGKTETQIIDLIPNEVKVNVMVRKTKTVPIAEGQRIRLVQFKETKEVAISLFSALAEIDKIVCCEGEVPKKLKCIQEEQETVSRKREFEHNITANHEVLVAIDRQIVLLEEFEKSVSFEISQFDH